MASYWSFHLKSGCYGQLFSGTHWSVGGFEESADVLLLTTQPRWFSGSYVRRDADFLVRAGTRLVM